MQPHWSAAESGKVLDFGLTACIQATQFCYSLSMRIMTPEIMLCCPSNKLRATGLARVRIDHVGLLGTMPGIRNMSTLDAGALLNMWAVTVWASYPHLNAGRCSPVRPFIFMPML